MGSKLITSLHTAFVRKTKWSFAQTQRGISYLHFLVPDDRLKNFHPSHRIQGRFDITSSIPDCYVRNYDSVHCVTKNATKQKKIHQQSRQLCQFLQMNKFIPPTAQQIRHSFLFQVVEPFSLSLFKLSKLKPFKSILHSECSLFMKVVQRLLFPQIKVGLTIRFDNYIP